MNDPRAQNCRVYAQDASGKVTGIELGITHVEGARYEVYSVMMIDEASAAGQTIATCRVLDKNGIETGEQARLAWPGRGPTFSDSALSGSGNNVHIISNGFRPPETGPLAIYVGGHNQPISDIIWGFGLPFKHHVSFVVVFKEKGGEQQLDTPASSGDTIIMPRITGNVSGFFGQLYDSGGTKYAHEGLDLALPEGTSVFAPYDGVVAWSDTHDAYGEYIRTYHEKLGVCFFFAHLSKRVAQNNGQAIKAGDLLGYTGNTGNSTGPHLHFEVRFMEQKQHAYRQGVSTYNNARVDPNGFIAGWVAAGNKIVEK
jgi:murein DD-endopeptidase MepM/ murein hydrolase activator NlpD